MKKEERFSARGRVVQFFAGGRVVLCHHQGVDSKDGSSDEDSNGYSSDKDYDDIVDYTSRSWRWRDILGKDYDNIIDYHDLTSAPALTQRLFGTVYPQKELREGEGEVRERDILVRGSYAGFTKVAPSKVSIIFFKLLPWFLGGIMEIIISIRSKFFTYSRRE
ncbi:hypothetical protein M5K25_018780 [Dendrobium thyrsiflorum]|uniref:Uncharacterized protein n=1 Tax=Dendrobium thyrsiflorum TaxID=117978 RepID=A0ABD0UD20_DENTH